LFFLKGNGKGSDGERIGSRFGKLEIQGISGACGRGDFGAVRCGRRGDLRESLRQSGRNPIFFERQRRRMNRIWFSSGRTLICSSKGISG
jgi:hypothetical protein